MKCLTSTFAISFTVILCASSAQARFLQADPTGYKDDLNLYAYVQNNPTNKTDPSGETCTGSGETLQCQLDVTPNFAGLHLDERAALQSKINNFNKRYTDTVKKLMSSGGAAPLSLPKLGAGAKEGDAASATISAQEVGNALISRQMVYSSSKVNPSTDEKTNTTYVTSGLLAGTIAPKFGGMSPGPAGSNVVLVHEGIHGTGTEAALATAAGGNTSDLNIGQPWADTHQPSYDAAAIQLYGANP